MTGVEITKRIYEVVDTRTPRGWVMIDRKFRILYANDAFCRMCQREKGQILGQSILELFYNRRKKNSQGVYYGPVIETMDAGRLFRESEAYLTLPSGRLVWCLVNTYLFYDDKGLPEYTVANYVVIDKFKAIERKLDHINMNIIKAFCKSIGARDAYTMHHVENVADLMVGLAEYMHLPVPDVALAYLVGLVHDIGKIGISENILNKPGRLTDEEYALIKRHATIGADILAEIEGFEKIAEVIRHHHERYDGKGYASGLMGEDIPLFSRMLAICDSFDAMTSMRCYRAPMNIAQAVEEIIRCTGTQFDPMISKSFIRYIQRWQNPQPDPGGSGCD